MGTNIFAFCIVLGVLIFFHELGHFLVARLFGVGVEKFSLGFGPRIFGKKIGRTDYRLSAIPLGGYVKMVGDEPDQDLPEEDIPYAFTHKHVFKRIMIVAAGPAFNLFLAALIFWGLFWTHGEFVLEPVIGAVTQGAPADRAGLEQGDRILAIDNQAIENWEQMAGIISGSQGRELEIEVERQGAVLKFAVRPEKTATKNIFGEDVERWVIGITSGGQYTTRPMGAVEAAKAGVVQTWELSRLTVISIFKIIKGSVSSKTLGGPLMIAKMAGQQAKAGATSLIAFIAFLSVSLAVLNFLPIPVLDGGHLFFFIIEAIIGKPVNTRVREIAQQAGIFILILLMIFVFYNDIMQLFFNAS